jgi:predicted unusual protein kinase regulating ubiquinone biosynthesis (AarF/ABC1/UbiB family)
LDLKAGKELIRFATIGAQVAVRRMFNREDGERFLHNTLSGMPGAPAKIGQLLGMRAAKEIPSPQPMPLEEAKALILAESPALDSQIQSLSEWSRTASLGETHQAILKNGDLVAVKIQYPGVTESLAAQVDAIFGVAGYSPAKNYDFDVGGTRSFLRQKLLEETDYRLEAENQSRFYDRYRGSSIIIPKIYSQYSSSKILTQSWEESSGLSVLLADSSREIRSKASVIFTAWVLDSMFGLGALHTDLNPSNYGFRVEGDSVKLVVYDFGSTYAVNRDHAILFYHWFDATRAGDLHRLRSAMEAMGFSATRLDPIDGKLLALSELIFKPLLNDSKWNAGTWNLQKSLDEVLGQDKWWFRTAGPPWFMYFMRTIQGWHHGLSMLESEIDLAAIWWPWEQKLRILALSFPLVKVDRTKTSAVDRHRELKAETLRVLVTEKGENIVELSMPARAVEDLEDLLPENVRLKCQSDGINLTAIKNQAIANGGEPQELFSASHGERQYRVWLL